VLRLQKIKNLQNDELENIHTTKARKYKNIDFKALIRYKKSLHRKGRSLLMGFSGGFKQGKPAKALLVTQVSM
jgi:hypothetical protein